MTLENCKRLLAKAETPEEKAFWEARIARKGGKVEAPKETKKDGKKPKG